MKIGILSFAHHHAEAYIHNLRSLPGVELLGVADEDAARGRRFAEAFATRFYPSFEALVEAKPDGVIITTANNQHRPLVEMAATRGVNVLCEKPIATTLEDARLELQACEKGGVLFMTAFPMRFSPPLLEVKRRLDAGELGQVYCFNATNRVSCPPSTGTGLSIRSRLGVGPSWTTPSTWWILCAGTSATRWVRSTHKPTGFSMRMKCRWRPALWK